MMQVEASCMLEAFPDSKNRYSFPAGYADEKWFGEEPSRCNHNGRQSNTTASSQRIMTSYKREKTHSEANINAADLQEEQQDFDTLIQKLNDLEDRSQELLADKSSYCDACGDDNDLRQTEQSFQTHYTTLKEAARDNDRIATNLRKLDALDQRLDAIIVEQGWECPDCDPNYIREIDLFDDVSDEVSEITAHSSRYQCAPIEGQQQPRSSYQQLPDKLLQQLSDSTLSTTGSTIDMSAEDEVNPLKEHEGCNNANPTIEYRSDRIERQDGEAEAREEIEISSPLLGSNWNDSFRDLHDDKTCARETFLSEENSNLSVSELLRDAQFLRSKDKHLVISPSPFTPDSPYFDEEQDSEETVCFFSKKKRNKEQECNLCTIQ